MPLLLITSVLMLLAALIMKRKSLQLRMFSISYDESSSQYGLIELFFPGFRPKLQWMANLL